MSDDDKNLIPAMSADELRAWTPVDVQADLDMVLNYLLRARTFYEGQHHPPHIEAALRLRAWLEGGKA